MQNSADDELFNLIKSNIIKNNLGIYISSYDKHIIEQAAHNSPDIYNAASSEAMEEINKIKYHSYSSEISDIKPKILHTDKLDLSIIQGINPDNKTIDFIKGINNNDKIMHFRVSGDSMINSGIHSGDLIIAETDVELVSNDIIIVSVNGEIYVKKLFLELDSAWLISENPNYEPVKITSDLNVKYIAKVKALFRML